MILFRSKGLTMEQQPSVSFAGPFVSIQRVYWDQLDLLGVLHNSAYLLLFERARTEFWRSLGISGYGDEKLDWPYLVARNEVNYRSPITSEQDVRVGVWVAKLGGSSITFGHDVLREDGTLAADGSTVIVRIDAQTQRPVRWSPGFRGMVARFLKPSV
jgi:acyl-CoA thioester hydrolase